jgi:chaperonin GroEL (HSP60 family)
MAVIYVGGGSDTELNENRDKMVDSLNATRNAIIDVK